MENNNKVKIVECPRDAMQGLHEFIATDVKAAYINSLLSVGFDTIDFGSFVSPKAIPQLRDTAEVLSKLNLNGNVSKLLAIIANVRGAEDAIKFEQISYLGFPFSVSETFQKRNTNSTIAESLITISQVQNLCIKNNKELVIYLSMGFGNPYGDDWNSDIVMHWVYKMNEFGIKIISIADTVGVANEEDISFLFKKLIPAFPHIEFGVHLHCKPDNWYKKVDAAYKNGCLRFDTAIKGYGGCPMADDELVGNLATENVIQYLKKQNVNTSVNIGLFNEVIGKADAMFNQKKISIG